MRLATSILALWCSASLAVTLQWTAPADLTGIDGYEIHYGPSSGVYDQVHDVPGATTNTSVVPDPISWPTTRPYYYAARSRNLDSTSFSLFSNEVMLAQGPTTPSDPVGVEIVYAHQENRMSTWSSSGSTNFNTASNWTPTGVPGATDSVVFDGATSNVNCVLNVAMDVASIDVQSDYTGTVDLADSAYSHAVSGAVALAGSGTVDLGDSTLTISGDFDYSGQTTLTNGSSEVIMDGTGAALTNSTQRLYDLTIDGTVTWDGTVNAYVDGTLTVNNGATFTFDNNTNYIYMLMYGPAGYGSQGFVNNGTIEFDGRRGIILRNIATTITFGTLVDNGSTHGFPIWVQRTNTIAGPATYPVTVQMDAQSLSHTITFTGDQTFQADLRRIASSGETLALDLSAGVDMTLQGDLIIVDAAGTYNWTKGTGSITLSGANSQDIDFYGATVEDIVVDKSAGTATLSGAVTTDSLSVDRGILDIDGQAVDVSGNLTSDPIAGAVTIQDTAATGSISITGNIDINGTATYGVTWTDADIDALSATGTNEASYATVSGSNNSSGNDITVTSGSVTTSTGWVEGGIVQAIGLASETDTAFVITGTKNQSIGLASEVDSAFAIARSKLRSIGLAAEADTAFAMAHSRALEIALALESDTAFTMSTSAAINIGLASETDTALAHAVAKQQAFGQASETDTANAMLHSLARTLALASEADSASAITHALNRAIGLASELDSALAVLIGAGVQLQIATETDTGQSFGSAKQKSFGLASEADTALAMTVVRDVAILLAQEADSALAMSFSTAKVIGLAQEDDSSIAVGGAKTLEIGLSNETDSGLAISPTRLIPVSQAIETDSSFVMDYSRGVTMDIAAELASAFNITPIGALVIRPEGLAYTLPLGRLHYVLKRGH